MIFDKGVKPFNREKDHFFQQMMLWKLDIHMQNNEVGHLPNTLYKNSLKMDQRPKHKS